MYFSFVVYPVAATVVPAAAVEEATAAVILDLAEEVTEIIVTLLQPTVAVMALRLTTEIGKSKKNHERVMPMFIIP